METTSIDFRVRYSETDQMGYVHHSNYVNYFEMGRIDWLRKMGLSYAEMEKKGILLPVQKLDIQYLKPAFYDDLLRLETTVEGEISVRITFHSQIFNAKKNTLLTKANITLVFLDTHTRRPIKPPTYFEEAIKNLNT